MTSNPTAVECSKASPDAARVSEQLQNLGDLRPFPATAGQIMDECRKPQPNIADVTRMIECEPAISTQVLSLANSPLYGSSRPIGTIAHATVILGFDSVSRMALSVAAGELFSQSDPVVAGFTGRIFEQSLACATVGRALAQNMGTCNPDETFLCGVMHDIGKLVFFDIVPDQYCEILEEIQDGQTTLQEQERFGTDHATVGKNCGVKWGLPATINAAIGNHHVPAEKIDHELSQLLVASDYYARQWQLSFGPDETCDASETIEGWCSTQEMASMADQCHDQFAAVCEICAIG